jgi:hypothetical protein
MKTTLHVKALLFILTFLLCSNANAQTSTFGIAARVGAFKTLVSNERSKETDFGAGLQFALGAWAKFLIAPKSNIQISLFQIAERQYAGEVQVVNEDRQPIHDAKVRDQNLAAVLQLVYLFTLNERWNIGAGLGSKYEYFSENRIEKEYRDYLIRPSYDNNYRRELTMHLPVEVQYKFNDRVTLVGQAQLQLSNRLKPAETKYTEHDLGATIGVNYQL